MEVYTTNDFAYDGNIYHPELDVEKLVKNLNKPAKVKKINPVDKSLEAVYQDIEENLKQKLSTKVAITSKGNGAGKIEIEFYSHDDLEKIMDLLSR